MHLHDICTAVTIPADSVDYPYQIRPIEACLPSFTKLLITLQLDVAETGYTYNYGDGGYSYGYTPATMSVYFWLQVSRDAVEWHNTSTMTCWMWLSLQKLHNRPLATTATSRSARSSW